MTYAVQEDTDLATSIDCCLLAAQLADFAENADCLVGELLEVWGGDARGCFGHCGEFVSVRLLLGRICRGLVL